MVPLAERHHSDRKAWWALGIFVANLAADFGLVAATTVLHAKFGISPASNQLLKFTLVQLGITGIAFVNFTRYPTSSKS